MLISGSLSHIVSCTLLLYWGIMGSSISFIRRRPYTSSCIISWPYSPSLTLFRVYLKCCVGSGLISKISASMLAWSRCAFSTLSQGWNLGCSGSRPWTDMWPSVTLYTRPLSSPILSLPRLGFSPSFQV